MLPVLPSRSSQGLLLAPLTVSLIVLALANIGVQAWWLFSESPHFPVRAEASFDLDGVNGWFTFSQKAANEPTIVGYDLSGLNGNNQLYHVHVRPLPAFDAEKVRNNATAIAALCGDPATGGHLNPHNITTKLPPKSAPLDNYEVGDLSGKHGPLKKATGKAAGKDRYTGSFTDDKLPMSGENSIVGRSVVIHKNDGKRWVCATIKEIAY